MIMVLSTLYGNEQTAVLIIHIIHDIIPQCEYVYID